MTYDMARPRYTLPFAGTDYELVGTFELIEAVEYAMKEGIIQVASRNIDMGVADSAKLIAALINASGGKTTPKAAGEHIVMDMGLESQEFLLLKLHINAFLKILFAPPKDREDRARQQGEIMGKLTSEPSASPGNSTGRPA